MSGAAAGGVVLRRGRRGAGRALAIVVSSALLLVIGWSALWAVARTQAAGALDAFVASEAAHGRRWSCPDRAITGFPFKIALACPGFAFAGVVDGTPAEGRLAGLRAEAYLHEPSSVHVTLDGPLALTSPDGRADVALDWSAFQMTLRGLVGGLRRVEVVLDGATLARPGIGTVRAGHVELRAGPAPGRPAEEAADAVDLAIAGASLPGLDALTGEGASLDAALTGVVTRAYGDLPDLGVATVERWRRAGGRLDVSSLTLAKGALRASATGRLGLDGDHRPSGRLDATLAGFGPLAKRFGLPSGALEAGGMIAALFGKRPAATAPGDVDLPIVAADGSLSVGPIRTPVRLAPLY